MDILSFGDPRDPDRLRQSWIRRRDPDRCRIVAGRPAPASKLRQRWRDAGGTDTALTIGLAEFVARQAALTLERAERQLRGARYKVPHLIHEEILDSPAFRGGLAKLARESEKSEASLARTASAYLREMAATHSAFVIDLAAHLIKKLYTLGYGEILHYDHEQLAGIAVLAQQYPVVFLPTHKSNLDHLSLQYMLHENGLPPNHTAGGINMNFFPVGPLVRRSGTFFIRRSFRDNTLYKNVLISYIDYLIEKRFTLEWYIEGGRSRSGKLLPPRFGMLAYVVDAFRRAKSDDVYLIPVSIGYDQIQDVRFYSAEARGGARQKEGFGWFISVVRDLSKRYGDIYIRFGEPLSLRAQLGAPVPDAEPDPDEQSVELQKLAFEVSLRINRVTAITPTSLVTLSLLGTGDRALTVPEVRGGLANLVYYVRQRKLPTTVDLQPLETDEGVRSALESLHETGVVSCYSEGPEAVYVIGPEQQLSAAYYRNTIIHFFVNSAIAELALVRAAERPVEDPAVEFWEDAMRLRDLLKFEFFFADKQTFQRELAEELSFQDPGWEQRLDQGPETIQKLVQELRPFTAHRVLRPFLESYQVVSDSLARRDPTLAFDQDHFLADCLHLGKQRLLQRHIRSAASVSKVLFQTALRLADNRRLLEPSPDDPEDLTTRRTAFAEEIRDALRRVHAIDALAATRRAGFIR
jgi:glycerol-3-phosphate O-acyltransferase